MPRGVRADRAETREEEETGRRTRIPMGGSQLKLGGPTRDGYVGRWVNDDPGRIKMFEDAGYAKRLVDGKVEKRAVGTNEEGKVKYAILMEQKQEYYDEDHAAKMAEVDEIDAAIARRNMAPSSPINQRGEEFYTPRGGAMKSHSEVD